MHSSSNTLLQQQGKEAAPIIHMQNLVKEYRVNKPLSGKFAGLRRLIHPHYIIKRAVDNISLSITEGEIVGYVGANGAGKSTTIKMLTGILMPTSGTLQVAGLVPWKQRSRNALNIGVVFGQRSYLWWDLPLIESFKLIAQMYGVSREKYQQNLELFIELLAMETFISTPVRLLSLGQRMRGDLAAAMLYEPRILYLDEPTVGLDVLAKEHIRGFIEKINQTANTTVLLTTHDLGDIERLCSRLVLIDQGRLIYDGSVTALKKLYTHTSILNMQLETEETQINIPGVTIIRQQGATLSLEYDPHVVTTASLISTISQHSQITDLTVTEPGLEAIIRKIYQGGQNNAELSIH